MLKKWIVGLVLAVALSSPDASIGQTWTSVAYITSVRGNAGPSPLIFQIFFDRAVDTNCAFDDRAVVRTSHGGALENVRDVALAALLSGREVEVLTTGACFDPTGHGTVAVVEYLGMR